MKKWVRVTRHWQKELLGQILARGSPWKVPAQVKIEQSVMAQFLWGARKSNNDSALIWSHSLWIMKKWVSVTRHWQKELLGQILAGGSPWKVPAQVKIEQSAMAQFLWGARKSNNDSALITCRSLHPALSRYQASFLGNVLGLNYVSENTLSEYPFLHIFFHPQTIYGLRR